MISIVAAMDEQCLIGNKGSMPWHCPADLQHFKNLTLHHDIVMGRTTYEGLANTLKERTVHIVTRKPMQTNEDIHICNDLKLLLEEWTQKKETLYVCGGADVYAQAIYYADEFWISYIHGTFQGDTWFPLHAIEVLSTCNEVLRIEYEAFTLVHYICIKKEG